MPQPFSLYNTLTKEIEPFVPLEEGKVRLYVCGMTVYDHIHVGHGRAMVVFDAFVRYLRYRGWDVKYVRNFTDVDDKLLNGPMKKEWNLQYWQKILFIIFMKTQMHWPHSSRSRTTSI